MTGYVAPQEQVRVEAAAFRGLESEVFLLCLRRLLRHCLWRHLQPWFVAWLRASVTGNGGHDSAWGFDHGVWAANAPELQEEFFGWRSNHVVTLIAKAITAHYYGKPIKYSYMGGGSKGGQAVLMEAATLP